MIRRLMQSFHLGLQCLSRQVSRFKKDIDENLRLFFLIMKQALDKVALLKIIFLIFKPKHMLRVLKRTISMRLFF